MLDIARAAGVSVATVSNYINRTKPVGKDTSARIAQVIDELHYIPNKTARVLKTQVNNTVGAVFPNIRDNYYAQIYQGLESRLAEYGYQVDLRVTGDIAELESRGIHELLENNVCAVFIITAQPENTDFFNKNIIERGIPLVQMDRKIIGIDAPYICFDNEKTVRQLMRYYHSLGKENITLICGSDKFSCENDAVSGFNDGSAKHKIIHIDLNKESAFRATVLHLKDNRPEAIITTSTLVTNGILESLVLLNLKVPDDVAVATLGEDNWNKHSDFQNILTTSREAIFAGNEAAKYLADALGPADMPVKKTTILEDKFTVPVKNGALLYEKTEALNVYMLGSLQVELFEGLLPRFENTYGTPVKIKKIEHQKILSEIYAADKSADVFMYDLPWLHSLVQDGILADITDIQKTGFDRGIYLKDSARIFGESRGRLWGLPFMYGPQILFYRKDIFNDKSIQKEFYKRYQINLRPPKTWEEFNTVSEFFTRRLNPDSPVEYGTAVPAAYTECLVCEIYMRLRAYGGEIFNKNNELVFNSNNTLRAYTNFIELLKRSSDKYRFQNDFDVVDEFLNGNLAMVVTYPPFISSVNDFHRSCRTGQTGFAYVPGKSPVFGGWGLGVSSKSRNKTAALKFIEWTCGEEMANYFTIMAGQSVITKTFDNNELISLYPWLPLYKETYDYAHLIIPPIKKGEVLIAQYVIDDIIVKNLYELMDGFVTVKTAVENTHTALRELLAGK